MTAWTAPRDGGPGAPGELPQLEIVRAATLAPSPDNNQPWRFRFDRGKLFVEHDRARALPSDVDRLFDLQSLGAAIENACIAARQFGFASQVRCLAEGAESTVAKIEFVTGAGADPLFPFLAERRTSRGRYPRRPLAADVIERLTEASHAAAHGVRLDWVANRALIRRIAGLVAAGDRLRFEYREFHAELYRQLRFTPSEVEQTRDGLDLRLLALPPGGALTLRLLRSWSLMSGLNRCGLSRLLTLSSALAVWQSGAIVVLSVAADRPANFLAAGRALERFWLAAAREGLGVHPLGSLPILLRRLAHAATPELEVGTDLVPLSRAHRRLSERLGVRLQEIVPAVGDRTVTMLLRIGYGRPTTLKSLRRAAEDSLAGQSIC